MYAAVVLGRVTLLLQALGVTVDMTSRTMGERTRRFAMYVDNGEVSSCLLPCCDKSLHQS